MIPNSWWLTALAGLILICGLPVVGRALRSQQPDHCEWDGLPVDPIYRVQFRELSGSVRPFCCVSCAAAWLKRSGSVSGSVDVTDELTGTKLDAREAFYVRSTVATNAVTGNRWHCFGTARDAENHAAAAHGKMLPFSDSPLSVSLIRPPLQSRP